MQILIIATLMISALMPIHRLPLPSFYSEWMLAAGMLVVVLAALRAAKQFSIRIDTIVAVIAAFIVLVASQYLTGSAGGGAAFFYIAYLGYLFLSYQAGSALKSATRSDSILWHVACAFLLSAIYSCLLGALQLSSLDLPFYLLMPRAGGISANVAQVNHFNDLIWLAICSAVYGLEQKKCSSVVLIASILVLMIFSTLTGSRSSIAYALGLALLPWLVKQPLPILKWRRKVWAGIFAIFCMIQLLSVSLGVFEYFGLDHGLIDRPEFDAASIAARMAAGAPSMPTASPRMDLWRQILPAMTPTGIGVGNFREFLFARPSLWTGALFDGPPEHAHNLFFQIGIEFGWITMAMFVVASGVWLTVMRRKEVDARVYWAISMLIPISVHSLIEYPLWYLNFLVPFGFFLGVCSWQIRAYKEIRVSVSLAAISCFAALVILGAAYKDYHTIEDTLMSMQMGIVGQDREWESLRAELHNSPPYSPYRGYAHLIRVMSLDPRRSSLLDLKGDCDDAVRLWITSPTLANCAAAYYVLGNRERAKWIMDRACTVKLFTSVAMENRFRLLTGEHGAMPWLERACGRVN